MNNKVKFTKIEKVGICGMTACGIIAIGGTVLFSPLFLAFIPVGCVVGNTCNLRKK